MKWLRHKHKKVRHLFLEKPYTKGWLKAVCGYIVYEDMLVEQGHEKVCKKCRAFKENLDWSWL